MKSRVIYPDVIAAIKEHKLTKPKVAKELNITLDSFKSKLYGYHEFTLEEIVELMNLFNKTYDELFLEN